jgi:cytochrome c biogenesis protein CcmG/thiol:disulfide interchange protein DsbE
LSHAISQGWKPYAAALAAALMLAGCSSPQKTGASHLKAEASRKPAPNFSLKDADGRIVQLSDFRGKVVLLNFWATWCDPCRIEIPWFVEFERQHKGQGFAVVGVSMDEDGWQAIKPFISEAGINYRILLGDDKIAELYGGIDSLPTSFVIDREGRIAAVHIGLVSKSRYENDLQQLFETPAKTVGAGARRFRDGARRAG